MTTEDLARLLHASFYFAHNGHTADGRIRTWTELDSRAQLLKTAPVLWRALIDEQFRRKLLDDANGDSLNSAQL